MPGFSPDGLIAFWNSMTPKQRKALAEALEEFHSLRASLERRGFIECDKSITKITIIKKGKETKKLMRLLRLTGAQGITIVGNSG